MIPHTVPKRPTKGVALPVVARKFRYRSSLAVSRLIYLFMVFFSLSLPFDAPGKDALNSFAIGLASD